MDREEILVRSRAEHQNKDVYEREVLKQASQTAIWVIGALATLFFFVQVLSGGGINFGIYALVFSGNMAISWVKYAKFRQKKELPRAVVLTLFTTALSGCHIYNLLMASLL